MAPPVVLRIKVRYEDPDAFVERFAPYVARAGVFLRSKTPKPVGTEVRFELRLADDRPVLVGMGIVRWAREPDPDHPGMPPGMAIEFTRVTKESRAVILKMLELRRRLGLSDGPRGLPNPPDDDAPVRAAPVDSAAIAAPPAPLPAEPPRARRPAPAELAASVAAPAPPADGDGELEIEQADIASVIARARALVGRDPERELAVLLDDDAAPVAITVEEASARLAALLGTAPVVRKRRADDSVPTEHRPAFVAPPPIAPQPVPEPVPVPDPPIAARDAESTKVVHLDADTRVVNLAAYAAETGREPDERTAVRRLPGAGDDDRTHVIAARARAVLEAEADADDTLDFERRPASAPQPVPRDFADDREPETGVRRAPARRTAPPPPPGRARGSQPTMSTTSTPPPTIALDDLETPDADDDALTPPPVEVGEPPRPRRAESSGSIDLTDLVSELEAESAAPVPLAQRLEGDALDADGLIGAFDRPRTPPPDDAMPDLASFADPPSSFHHLGERPATVDAALAALEHDDDHTTDDAEERTSWARPSRPVIATAAPRAATPPADRDDGDDGVDDVSIEIDLDD